jgi:hypothetical protein
LLGEEITLLGRLVVGLVPADLRGLMEDTGEGRTATGEDGFDPGRVAGKSREADRFDWHGSVILE